MGWRTREDTWLEQLRKKEAKSPKKHAAFLRSVLHLAWVEREEAVRLILIAGCVLALVL